VFVTIDAATHTTSQTANNIWLRVEADGRPDVGNYERSYTGDRAHA